MSAASLEASPELFGINESLTNGSRDRNIPYLPAPPSQSLPVFIKSSRAASAFALYLSLACSRRLSPQSSGYVSRVNTPTTTGGRSLARDRGAFPAGSEPDPRVGKCARDASPRAWGTCFGLYCCDMYDWICCCTCGEYRPEPCCYCNGGAGACSIFAFSYCYRNCCCSGV